MKVGEPIEKLLKFLEMPTDANGAKIPVEAGISNGTHQRAASAGKNVNGSEPRSSSVPKLVLPDPKDGDDIKSSLDELGLR